MDLAATDVLCIYGIAGGDLYASFQSWLHQKEERYLIYLEDDEESFTSFLLSEQTKDPQVKAFFFREEDAEELFKQIAWQMVFLRFSYLPHPLYLSTRPSRAQEIIARISYIQTAIHLLASDYSDRGAGVLRNIFANASLSAKAIQGEKLRGAFQGIPAIICGAGPSLQKNLVLLPELKDKALLFAGGASLNALEDLSPHFAAGIDPDPPLSRFLAHSAFTAPFCYQSRYASQLLSLVQGSLVYFPGSGMYPIENWLHEDQSFDGGWTVGTFCLALSHFFGCDPIILVGMDLATKGEQLYASGVADSSSLDSFLRVAEEGSDIYYSKRDWIMAAEWISSFAKAHKEAKIINATEGGLKLKEISHITLREVKQTYLTQSYDLKGKVQAQLQRRNLICPDVTQRLEGLKESLKRCDRLCDEMLAWFEKTYPYSPREKGQFVLCEFDLEEEIAFQKVFSPIWNIWRHLFERRLGSSAPLQLQINQLLFFKRLMQEL